jgi:hypothetical protein
MRRCKPFLIAAAAALAGACAPSGLPSLPSAINAPPAANAEGSAPAIETTIIVPGTPTDVYALVAHGALRCWLGPDGPLHATHVFDAEAKAPADGGTAQIVIHERDPTMRDQRGTQAFRVSFDIAPGGTRVATTPLKMPAQIAPLMVRDVEAWARGGSGCQVMALQQPPAQPAETSATQPKQAKPAGVKR